MVQATQTCPLGSSQAGSHGARRLEQIDLTYHFRKPQFNLFTRMNQMRTRALCTCFLALIAALLLPMIAVAGHYYETTTTNDRAQQGKKKKGKQNVSRTRAWIDGPNAKVEFIDGEDNGIMAKGTYLVTTDGGENLYLVNPKEKTYGVFDLEAMLALAGNMMNAMGGMMQLEFTDFKNEKLLEEDGDSILGYSTTHYQYDTGYTMSMSVMGMNRENRTEMIQDMWCTDDLDAKGFYVWLRPDKFRTGNAEFDKLIKTEMGRVKGFPLKTTTITKMVGKKGKETTMSSTMEVTALREEAIPSSLYVIPEDYEETQMMTGMPPGYEGYGQGQPPQGEDDEQGSSSGLSKKGDG